MATRVSPCDSRDVNYNLFSGEIPMKPPTRIVYEDGLTERQSHYIGLAIAIFFVVGLLANIVLCVFREQL